MLNVNEISPGIVVYACVDTLYNEGVRTTLRNTHPMLCIDCNATESEWVILTSMFTELEVKSRWKLGPVNWIKKKSYIDTARSSHRIPNDVMQKASEIGESDYYHERYERPMVRPAGVAAITQKLEVRAYLSESGTVKINELSVEDLERLLEEKRESVRRSDLLIVLSDIEKQSGYVLTSAELRPQ